MERSRQRGFASVKDVGYLSMVMPSHLIRFPGQPDDIPRRGAWISRKKIVGIAPKKRARIKPSEGIGSPANILRSRMAHRRSVQRWQHSSEDTRFGAPQQTWVGITAGQLRAKSGRQGWLASVEVTKRLARRTGLLLDQRAVPDAAEQLLELHETCGSKLLTPFMLDFAEYVVDL
jgi:hypothetical protein